MDIKALLTNTPKRQLYLLFGLLGIAILAGWWFYLYQPARQHRDVLRGQAALLQQDLFQKQRISQELPKLEAAREQLQRDLDEAQRRLPKEKEIPTLLTQINRLGQESGLIFTLFKPGKPTQDEFYTRVPIQVRAEGTFHALGHFFEQVSRMERIVNITDMKLDQADPRRKGATEKATIVGEFTATTFTFGGAQDEEGGGAKGAVKKGSRG